LSRINYNDYIKNMRAKSLQLYTRHAALTPKIARTKKPRDLQEDLILFLLDYQRWQKALATGRIEKKGARRYRWNG